MKRPAASVAGGTRKKPTGSEPTPEDAGNTGMAQEEAWDCTTNPPMWIGGYGNSGTDPTKHVAKQFLQKGVGWTLKACAGQYQCVILSTQNLNMEGETFSVELKLTAANKCFDFYLGIVGQEGLGSYDHERWFTLGAGTPCSISHKFPSAAYGSCSMGDMAKLVLGDVMRMTVQIGATDDTLAFSINGEEVRHPELQKAMKNPRAKAKEKGRAWRGWRPFICLTSAGVTIVG